MKRMYTTKKSSVELQLRPVEPLALHNILYRIGLDQTASREELAQKFEAKSIPDKQRAAEALNQLFGYCIMQGVETNAPPEGLAELEAMGFPTSNPNIARLYWLRCVELQNQTEAGELIGAIIALTFRPDAESKAEFVQATEDD